MTDQEARADDNVDRFVGFIQGLDAGGRAALRRSLAFPPGTWPGAFQYVEPWVVGAQPWSRNVAYLVAGLQAHARTQGGKGDMGGCARRLALASDSGSVELRFLALLDSDPDQLPHRMRQMITLMSSWDIAPDWAKLRRDLNWWRNEERTVQQRWARSYYAHQPSTDQEPSTGDGNDSSEMQS